jgi:hypothetical protein
LLDHSFALVAPEIAAGSYIDFARLEIGRLAVDVFFIVSGFLVTRSVMTQPTLVDYAVARFLRLFPALFVATIFIAFVLGPLVTTASLHDYFGDSRPWIYVPLTARRVRDGARGRGYRMACASGWRPRLGLPLRPRRSSSAKRSSTNKGNHSVSPSGR